MRAERTPGPDWLAVGNAGPRIRTNMVTVYLFRRPQSARGGDVEATEFLQLRRTFTRASFMSGTWQPVSGGIEVGEMAVETAFREAFEEVRLCGPDVLGAWHVDQVRPFLIPSRDLVILPASFAVEVRPDWEPVLNEEHDAHRWVTLAEAPRLFMWRGQRLAVQDIAEDVLRPGPLGSSHLCIPPEVVREAMASCGADPRSQGG